ncbi:MAG TPA: YhbY family RNA-binding protein [Quisquiliibacterium sp.]|nr:YhbY family RNA-binding protein [Quisquiliibacterium sp.]
MQMTDPSDIPVPAPVLTPADRKELRARAHHLKPVVMIGEAGLTDAVLAEARRAIEVHELIKIRVLGDDREVRNALMQQVCESLSCAPVQMIGKLLVVYRPRPEDATAGGRARPKGPHVPKKAAATGGKASATRAKPRGKAAPKAAPRPAAPTASPRQAPARSGPRADGEPAPRTRVWSTEVTGRPTTRVSRDERGDERGGRAAPRKGAGGKPAAGRTAGKRTDLSSSKSLAPRRGRAAAASQGPARLQGKPGARTSGPRDRSRKR